MLLKAFSGCFSGVMPKRKVEKRKIEVGFKDSLNSFSVETFWITACCGDRSLEG